MSKRYLTLGTDVLDTQSYDVIATAKSDALAQHIADEMNNALQLATVTAELDKAESKNRFLSGVISGIENAENEKLEQVTVEQEAMREALQKIATTHRLDPRLAGVAYGYQQIALAALKGGKG